MYSQSCNQTAGSDGQIHDESKLRWWLLGAGEVVVKKMLEWFVKGCKVESVMVKALQVVTIALVVWVRRVGCGRGWYEW